MELINLSNLTKKDLKESTNEILLDIIKNAKYEIEQLLYSVDKELHKSILTINSNMAQALDLVQYRADLENTQKDQDVNMKEYKAISVELLFVDSIYQRDISNLKVSRLVKNWNEVVNMPILVSKRKNGLYSIIDGQHRFMAMKTKGLKHVICKVIEGLSIEEEAQLFTTTNKDRKTPSSGDMFRANLAAKDDLHMKINEIVESHGYELSFTGLGGKTKSICNQIQAVGTLKRICERISVDNLDKTLKLINIIWGNNKEALSGQVLSGVSRFINGADRIEYFDEGRLIEKLKRKAPYEIIREGKSYKIQFGGEMETNIALAIIDTYNDRLRGGRLQVNDILQTDRSDYIDRNLV